MTSDREKAVEAIDDWIALCVVESESVADDIHTKNRQRAADHIIKSLISLGWSAPTEGERK